MSKGRNGYPASGGAKLSSTWLLSEVRVGQKCDSQSSCDLRPFVWQGLARAGGGPSQDRMPELSTYDSRRCDDFIFRCVDHSSIDGSQDAGVERGEALRIHLLPNLELVELLSEPSWRAMSSPARARMPYST
jgi:hypothetical protein